MKLNIKNTEIFWSCFEKSPQQGPVGISAKSFFNEINSLHGPINQDLDIPLNRKLERNEVKNLVRNMDIDPLIGYALIMAWGGRNMRNFRKSISKQSIDKLIKLLHGLRNSNSNRADDFSFTKNLCFEIKGLGISFYTKLLYFLREDNNAYILDQWTAKSVIMLFDECPIKITKQGIPHGNTSPENYEWFCQALEFLGKNSPYSRQWNGEEVERAIFDNPKGIWRNKVKNNY